MPVYKPTVLAYCTGCKSPHLGLTAATKRTVTAEDIRNNLNLLGTRELYRYLKDVGTKPGIYFQGDFCQAEIDHKTIRDPGQRRRLDGESPMWVIYNEMMEDRSEPFHLMRKLTELYRQRAHSGGVHLRLGQRGKNFWIDLEPKKPAQPKNRGSTTVARKKTVLERRQTTRARDMEKKATREMESKRLENDENTPLVSGHTEKDADGVSMFSDDFDDDDLASLKSYAVSALEEDVVCRKTGGW